MAAIDFITVLGRVLRDGKLRDEFARDAATFVQQSGLRAEDHVSFLQLDPVELEQQARVLLRKRFDLVRRFSPETCRALGNEAWTEFECYGRSSAPTGKHPAAEDAASFAEHLRTTRPGVVRMSEFVRARFVCRERRTAFFFGPGTWLTRNGDQGFKYCCAPDPIGGASGCFIFRPSVRVPSVWFWQDNRASPGRIQDGLKKAADFRPRL